MSKEQTSLVFSLISDVISHVIQILLEGKIKVALAPDKILANLTHVHYKDSTGALVPVNIIEVYDKKVILLNKIFLDALENNFHISSRDSIFDKKIILLEVFKKGVFREDEFAIVACKPHEESSTPPYKISINNKTCIFVNKTTNILYVPNDKIINLSKKYLDPNKGAMVILALQVIVELMPDCITFTTEYNKIVALIVLSGKTFECKSLPLANEFILESGALITYENENHELFYAQNLSDQDLSLNIIGLIGISTSFEHC